MSHNKDELVAPEWVNKEFLEKVLNNAEGSSDVKLNAYKVAPGSEAGDHYASIVFRIKLNYSLKNENKELSVVLKTMPEADGFKKDTLEGINLFEKEIKMYTEALPQFQDELEKAGTYYRTAKIYYHSLQPKKFIVLENLKSSGFEMLPRFMANLTELQLIVTKLATFHAGSVKAVSNGNKELTYLRGGILNTPNIRDLDAVVSGLKLLKQHLAAMPEYEIYAKKINEIPTDAFMERCIDIFKNPGSINVLNHADFHIKNMMFKLNEENIGTEVIFLDYQVCSWGTPALDLSYITLLNPEESKSDLVELYYRVFADLLKKMNYAERIPTFDDLKAELKNCRQLDLFVFATFLPISCMDDFPNIDMELNMTSPEYRASGYKSLAYKKLMNKYFPVFLKDGILDWD